MGMMRDALAKVAKKTTGKNAPVNKSLADIVEFIGDNYQGGGVSPVVTPVGYELGVVVKQKVDAIYDAQLGLDFALLKQFLVNAGVDLSQKLYTDAVEYDHYMTLLIAYGANGRLVDSSMPCTGTCLALGLIQDGDDVGIVINGFGTGIMVSNGSTLEEILDALIAAQAEDPSLLYAFPYDEFDNSYEVSYGAFLLSGIQVVRTSAGASDQFISYYSDKELIPYKLDDFIACYTIPIED